MCNHLFQKVLLCFAIACLNGCSSLHSPFDGESYVDNDSQTDSADSTDDVPYAIGQYLEQIRVAGNAQEVVPATNEKLAPQKQ